MSKRAELYEEAAENVIYVLLPKKAMQMTEFQKSNIYFQYDFISNLDKQLNDILNAHKDNLQLVAEKLKIPLQEIYDFEDFLKKHIREIQEMTETVKNYITISDADDEELEFLEAITEALQNIEDLGRQIIQRILEFHTTRSRLFCKLLKRKLYDVAKTLVQHDIGQITEIQSGFGELMSEIIMGYDVAARNYELYKNNDKFEQKTEEAMY